jgi:hypothetical protein
VRETASARPAPPWRRPSALRRLAAATLLLAAPALSGCAVLIGFPVSPLTGALGGIVHSESSGWDVLWGYPLGFIAGAIWGPVMALSIGISADLGYCSNGAYGERGSPAMFDALDPYGYCLSKPEPTGTKSPP